MAETIAEAEAQQFVLPEHREWRKFALLLDGYMIAKEMGVNLGEWGEAQEARFRSTGEWHLSVLELRLMLFYACRRERWTTLADDLYVSAVFHGNIADSLLRAISVKTGLPYISPRP